MATAHTPYTISTLKLSSLTSCLLHLLLTFFRHSYFFLPFPLHHFTQPAHYFPLITLPPPKHTHTHTLAVSPSPDLLCKLVLQECQCLDGEAPIQSGWWVQKASCEFLHRKGLAESFNHAHCAHKHSSSTFLFSFFFLPSPSFPHIFSGHSSPPPPTLSSFLSLLSCLGVKFSRCT